MADMTDKINASLVSKYIDTMKSRKGKCPFLTMGVHDSHVYTMDNYLHNLPDIWCGSGYFSVINGMINDCIDGIESGEIQPNVPITLENYVVNEEPSRIIFREASVIESKQIEEMCMVGRMERLLRDKPDVYEQLSGTNASPKWWVMEISDVNNKLPSEEGYVSGIQYNVDVSALHARYMEGFDE